METLTDQELLDTVIAVGPQAVLDVYASADQFRMPGEQMHPSFVGRVFLMRAGQIARSPLPVVDADAYERLAAQLAFGNDTHAFMHRLHKTAWRLRPRGSDGHEAIAARIDALRELRTERVLAPELVERLGPRNRG